MPSVPAGRPTSGGSTSILLLFVVTLLSGCSEPLPEPEIISLSDEEAHRAAEQARAEVSVHLTEGIDVQLWASDSLMADPVALYMDDLGRAWITVTNRRRTSSLDIRSHPDWEIPSLAMEAVEDRREFLRYKLSSENSDENSSWLPDRNEDGVHDWRDLAVEEEEVYRIEDMSGDGLANQSQLFYRGFNDEVTDIAGAILYHEGDVFVGAAPDLWRIRDTRGDGVGDTKESISHGYAVHLGFGGHGMSGLTVGPDGRLYWSIGDYGLHVVDAEGEEWAYPRQGAILRSEPDGSNFEVVATGFRNTHEFTFDKYGNLITVDNDGDFPGEFERLLYVIDGADAGWRINWQFGKYTDPKNNAYNVWMYESYFHPRFDDRAAHVLPALARYHNGPAGMVYNPGTALSERWTDHFFVASFVGASTRSGVDAFTLEPKGASFELATDEEVMRGILATGMDFGPDGALYVADWIEGWATNDEGRIWKLDTSEDAHAAIREETRELLAASFDERSDEDLVELMGHTDMRVRQKAQFELVAREAYDQLRSAIARDDHQLRRIHGIWGVGQLSRHGVVDMEPLIEWLGDGDPEIRAQIARTLGDVRYEPAGDALMELLNDTQERVQFFAAEALGRIRYAPARDAIVDMLEANDDEDIYLRQAGAIALARIGQGDALTDLANHSSRAVRVAALVALQRMKHPGVARFLDDEDEYIATNAARAINDDEQIEDALPALASMLEQERFVNEPLLRRAINASLYSGSASDADRLARFAVNQTMAEDMRVEALATLSVWPSPSVLDRVTGQYRGEIQNDVEPARQAIASASPTLLQDRNPAVREATAEALAGLQYAGANEGLAGLVQNDPIASVRITALRALHELNYDLLDEVLAVALDDEDPSVRRAALGMLPDVAHAGDQVVELLGSILENGSLEEQQNALDVLGRIDHEAAIDLLDVYIDLLIADEAPREIELDILLAVERANVASLNQRVEDYQSEKPADDLVAVYRESLYGGDAEVGRSIFTDHVGAQCMRCHVVGREGSEVGPDLTDVGGRLSREQLLEAMVDPSARLAPGYGVVAVTLESGETVRGVVEEETDTALTIRRSDGDIQMVESSEIVARESTISPMPSMRGIVSRSELRDLVEYLTTLREE